MVMPVVNPFGFLPTQNPFYVGVVSRAVTYYGDKKRAGSPTYLDPKKSAKYQETYAAGESAKAEAMQKLQDRYNTAKYMNFNPDAIAREKERQKLLDAQRDKTTAIPLKIDPRFASVDQLAADEGLRYARLHIDENISRERNALLKNEKNNRTEQRFTAVPRQPFVLTCQKWINESSMAGNNAQQMFEQYKSVINNKEEFRAAAQTAGNANSKEIKYIYCNVNPSQISWEFPLRAVDQMTLAGRVQHVWRSTYRSDSYFNEPTIRFSFQSGNIMPLKFMRGFEPRKVTKLDKNKQPIELVDGYNVVMDTTPTLPGGLSNFYKFFDLFNQPKLISMGGSRQANLTYIFYNSPVFPQMVLTGMWDPQGISFEENSSEPNQVNWSASFTVYDSYPKFTDYTTLAKTYVGAGFGNIRGSSANTPASPTTSTGYLPFTPGAQDSGNAPAQLTNPTKVSANLF